MAFVPPPRFFIRRTKREIRFQSKLINMQFVIPRVVRAWLRFSFFFFLSLILSLSFSLHNFPFSSTSCTKMRLKIHTPLESSEPGVQRHRREPVFILNGCIVGGRGESRDETFSRHVALGRIIFDRVFLRVFSRCVPIGVLASRIERIREKRRRFIYIFTCRRGRNARRG